MGISFRRENTGFLTPDGADVRSSGSPPNAHNAEVVLLDLRIWSAAGKRANSL